MNSRVRFAAVAAALSIFALSATAEVFNATNNGTVLERSSQIGTFDNRPGRNTFTPVAFNTILETQSPRILRLGGRITF